MERVYKCSTNELNTTYCVIPRIFYVAFCTFAVVCVRARQYAIAESGKTINVRPILYAFWTHSFVLTFFCRAFKAKEGQFDC